MVTSVSDLFILGDVPASFLFDLYKFMQFKFCYWVDDVLGDKMSPSRDIDPVVIKEGRKIPKGQSNS